MGYKKVNMSTEGSRICKDQKEEIRPTFTDASVSGQVLLNIILDLQQEDVPDIVVRFAGGFSLRI